VPAIDIYVARSGPIRSLMDPALGTLPALAAPTTATQRLLAWPLRNEVRRLRHLLGADLDGTALRSAGDDDPIPALPFGSIHRRVGSEDELGGRGSVLRVRGDAD
jgi:hypothetical protein